MTDLRIEEAREMYGLAIVALWMILIVVARVMRARGAQRAESGGRFFR
jgi:hypothetical protein